MTREELKAAIRDREEQLKALDREMGIMWRRRVRLIDELEELRKRLEEAAPDGGKVQDL